MVDEDIPDQDPVASSIARRLMGLIESCDNVIDDEGTEVFEAQESARSDSEFVVVARAPGGRKRCYRVTVVIDVVVVS